MVERLEGMAGDLAMESTEALLAATESEKALLGIAQTRAQQAMRIEDLEQEDDRIRAAKRQVKLLGQLYGQHQALTQPTGRQGRSVECGSP